MSTLPYRSSGVKNERGAVAVLVGILSIVLFAVAALAVDLSNAFVRKRDTQAQADFAALAAGAALPATASTPSSTDPAVVAVARYLVENQPTDDGGPSKMFDQATLQTMLTDDDPGNGEAYYGSYASDGTFVQSNNEITVVTPPRLVKYGFARVVGADDVAVAARATVRIESTLPPPSKVLPFVIPDSCPFGAGMADTSSNGKNKADTSGSFDPGNSSEGSVAAVSPAALDGDDLSGPSSVKVTVSDLGNNKSLADVPILFQLGGATYLVTGTAWTPSGTTDNSSDTREITVQVPEEVLATPGDWNIWGKTGNNKYTTNSETLTVGEAEASDSGEIGCDASASGQFGQMYSPRGNAAADQRGLALNIALGLDHQLVPWLNGPAECGKKNASPPTGGIQDKPNPGGDPNCVMPQTGNDGPWMLQGLITGVDGTPGRLDVSNPNGGSTRPGCGSDAVREGKTINNDRLTCFMLTDDPLSKITSTSLDPDDFEGLLDPDIVDSPRFVWLPVIHAQTRTEIDNNTFQTIKRFVPGFITDESVSARRSSSDATTENGVVIGGQLDALQVMMFNPLALPVEDRGPTTVYDPLMGHPVTRLID